MARTRSLRTSAPTNLTTQAKRIRHARIKCGLTQEQLAQRVSVLTGRATSKSVVSKWESGKTKNPHIDTFNALSRITGFSPDWLNTGNGEPMRRVVRQTLNNKALGLAIDLVLDGSTDHKVKLICDLYRIIVDGENFDPSDIAGLREIIRNAQTATKE